MHEVYRRIDAADDSGILSPSSPRATAYPSLAALGDFGCERKPLWGDPFAVNLGRDRRGPRADLIVDMTSRRSLRAPLWRKPQVGGATGGDHLGGTAARGIPVAETRVIVTREAQAVKAWQANPVPAERPPARVASGPDFRGQAGRFERGRIHLARDSINEYTRRNYNKNFGYHSRCDRNPRSHCVSFRTFAKKLCARLNSTPRIPHSCPVKLAGLGE
jgi:hypothetical protein